MTKKEEKAKAVAARKREAYFARARALAFHAWMTSRFGAMNALVEAGYAAGKKVEVVAAEIASREPVGKAIQPIRAAAIDRARKNARKVVKDAYAKLAATGWDANAVAPYPPSGCSYFEWKIGTDRYYLYRKITKSASTASRRPGEAEIVEKSRAGAAKFEDERIKEAASNFDAFVVKLVGKVGDVASAKLREEDVDGYGLWLESYLTVEKRDGSREVWKTREITNRSVLGLYFPQWPTRLVKGSKATR